MANRVHRAAETWDYVLRDDRKLPAEEQSRFTLRPLTQEERQRYQDRLVSKIENADGVRETVFRSNTSAFQIALSNIVSIENFPAGEPMPWPESRADRIKYVSMLSDAYVIEIGDEIWGKSLVEDAVKNS